MATSKRAPYHTRSFLLVSIDHIRTAMDYLQNAPVDWERPIECLIREKPKARKADQNAAMWAGPLSDIANQAFVNGKRFSAEVWHEHFKELYLPEEFDPELCKEGYQKWAFTPAGKRFLIGSTTQLLVKGFSLYLQQVEAFAASELGVRFSVNPNERGARFER